MPLHAQEPSGGACDLDTLDHALLGASDDLHAAPQLGEALVVVAGGLDLVADDAREQIDRAERILGDYARRQRGEVKVHDGPATGKIARLFPDDGYGFIETADIRDVYFHRNAVLDGVTQ